MFSNFQCFDLYVRRHLRNQSKEHSDVLDLRLILPDVHGREDNLPLLLENFLQSKKGIFLLFSELHTRLTLLPGRSWPPPRLLLLLLLHNEHVKTRASFLFYLLTLQRESMQNLTCLLYHQHGGGSQICPRCIRAKASHRGRGGRWVEVRLGGLTGGTVKPSDRNFFLCSHARLTGSFGEVGRKLQACFFYVNGKFLLTATATTVLLNLLSQETLVP